jgi:hypothetical protein
VNRFCGEISDVNLHSEGSAEFKGRLEKDGDKRTQERDIRQA